MDLERIYNKLESMDSKLDNHLERIAILEVHNKNISGKIKLLFSIAIAAISALITAAGKWAIDNITVR